MATPSVSLARKTIEEQANHLKERVRHPDLLSGR